MLYLVTCHVCTRFTDYQPTVKFTTAKLRLNESLKNKLVIRDEEVRSSTLYIALSFEVLTTKGGKTWEQEDVKTKIQMGSHKSCTMNPHFAQPPLHPRSPQPIVHVEIYDGLVFVL